MARRLHDNLLLIEMGDEYPSDAVTCYGGTYWEGLDRYEGKWDEYIRYTVPNLTHKNPSWGRNRQTPFAGTRSYDGEVAVEREFVLWGPKYVLDLYPLVRFNEWGEVAP